MCIRDRLYPTATAKELTYYVSEGVLKPVGKEYIFSELVIPVYNRNGNQVTASLAVKYLDNQTMTTQVSPVSYTHLDVYKRQVLILLNHLKSIVSTFAQKCQLQME